MKFLGVLFRRDANVITKLADRAREAAEEHNKAIERFQRVLASHTNTGLVALNRDQPQHVHQRRVRSFKGNPF